jgi:predicted DNA-binding transcriptional regulator AlpA
MEIMVDWKGLKALGFPYCRAHTWRLEQAGLFPKRRRLNPDKPRSRVAWVLAEVRSWFESRPV